MIAILRMIASVAGDLLSNLLGLLAVLWDRAGRLIATVAAVGLLALSLVQCGEVRALQASNGALWTEREALQSDLTTCRAGRDALTASLSEQSAAVEALERESARRVAEAEDAVQRAAQGRQDAERRAAAILAASEGSGGVCDRLLAVDSAVMEGLR